MSDVTLLTSVVQYEPETTDTGFTVTRISISGEPHAAAIVNAVRANYHRLSGRPKPTQEMIDERIGEKVTLIQGGENMLGSGMITAREGKLFTGERGGIGILPKGKRTKGYVVSLERTVDILDGWVMDEAAELVASARSHYPQLVNLTRERLLELPGEDEGEDEMCTLAVFGTNPAWDSPDSLWLIGEYWPEEDICDRNVLLIRPEHGISEHGSCYGRDLLNNRAIGEVVGFEPISFREAIELTSLDYDEAIARALGGDRQAVV